MRAYIYFISFGFIVVTIYRLVINFSKHSVFNKAWYPLSVVRKIIHIVFFNKSIAQI